MSLFSFLDRKHTIAGPGFSRWMVPPAALCVHLCIGQAYAFSVFNLPMTKLIGITQSAPDDWKLTELGWIFSIAIFFLGASAAVFGRWVEEGGPRRAMFTAALCFGGGFLVAALGVSLHQLWIIYLGYGVLGGIGLGIGYISPVSTLIKWFPDRPGMATGMAIMGFGGGAFIASPLSVWLMAKFSSPTPVLRCRSCPASAKWPCAGPRMNRMNSWPGWPNSAAGSSVSWPNGARPRACRKPRSPRGWGPLNPPWPGSSPAPRTCVPRRWSGMPPRSAARSPGSSTVPGKGPADDVTEGAAQCGRAHNGGRAGGARPHSAAAGGAGLAARASHPWRTAHPWRP